MKNNTVVIGDSEYVMNQSYLAGAQAFRNSVPCNCNPHTYGTQAHDDWDWGHTHDSAGEHFRFGKDLITVTRNGSRFEIDDAVPRDENGDAQDAWVLAQQEAFGLKR
jgi:hypothetical protein